MTTKCAGDCNRRWEELRFRFRQQQKCRKSFVSECPSANREELSLRRRRRNGFFFCLFSYAYFAYEGQRYQNERHTHSSTHWLRAISEYTKVFVNRPCTSAHTSFKHILGRGLVFVLNSRIYSLVKVARLRWLLMTMQMANDVNILIVAFARYVRREKSTSRTKIHWFSRR